MNSIQIGLYIVGKKGYSVLQRLCKERIKYIGYVVSSRDNGVDNDYYEEIKLTCEQNNIFFFDKNHEFKNGFQLANYKFCIGWRWLIDDPEGLIVFHDSILPKYRGFSPLVNMLINGEREIGVTALKASSEYDKGDIFLSESIAIEYPIKISKAIDKIIPLYENIVLSIIYSIENKCLTLTRQNENEATYSLWRDSKDYFINWSKDAEWILRFCNSVSSPYLGAQTFVDGQHVRIDDCSIVEDVFVESRENNIGKIIFLQEGHPVVICGNGLLKIRKMSLMNGENFSLKKFRVRFGEMK